eukprot:CAMPEP_0117433100 /NCGR_PEP_ID=MMETSP0758-20121206/12504_1 /TAXON_ID=63605 /ORGANISM="Percolomonas cosmopolitus, Strain AE-1 (ATCC 50343)" /LENGTH=419 /DNA_ID=CAMNT_0005223511 /DNA_START=194 /DNA_END=1450 /DNA_ORIENTATION=-
MKRKKKKAKTLKEEKTPKKVIRAESQSSSMSIKITENAKEEEPISPFNSPEEKKTEYDIDAVKSVDEQASQMTSNTIPKKQKTKDKFKKKRKRKAPIMYGPAENCTTRSQSLYKDILKQTKKANIKFRDLEFKATKKNTGSLLAYSSWKRLSEIYESPTLFGVEKNSKKETKAFLRTEMRENLVHPLHEMSWFLSTITAVIACGSLKQLHSIIEGEPEYGVYLVTFHWKGKKVCLYVDDYIPVDHANEPCLSHFVNVEESGVWPCILEKAYAKFLGSFSSLFEVHQKMSNFSNFTPAEAISMLLGGKPQFLAWQSSDTMAKETKELIHDHSLWETLLAQKKRVIMLLPAEVTGKGLVNFHGYTLLDAIQVSVKNKKETKTFVLCCVRSTWGKSAWNGKWGTQSKMWEKHDVVAQKLQPN